VRRFRRTSSHWLWWSAA